MIIYILFFILILVLALQCSNTDESLDYSGGKVINNNYDKTYDEYDNLEVIKEKTNYLDEFNNLIIDGSNMIYAYADVAGFGKSISISRYVNGIKKLCNMLSSFAPDKKIYFVIKDSDNYKQRKDFENHTGTFDNLAKDLPDNVILVVAYGNTYIKYRDDFMIIYIADKLPKSIIITRDRYRNTNEMVANNNYSIDAKFYNNKGPIEDLNSKFNEPLKVISGYTSKFLRCGYTFKINLPQGCYNKSKKKRTNSSDYVIVFDAYPLIT